MIAKCDIKTRTLVLFAAAAGGRGCVALLPLAPLVVLLGRAVVLVVLVVLFSGNSGGTNSSFGERESQLNLAEF